MNSLTMETLEVRMNYPIHWAAESLSRLNALIQ